MRCLSFDRWCLGINNKHLTQPHPIKGDKVTPGTIWTSTPKFDAVTFLEIDMQHGHIHDKQYGYSSNLTKIIRHMLKDFF